MYLNEGNISSEGGGISPESDAYGGAGGNGSVTIGNISSGKFIANDK